MISTMTIIRLFIQRNMNLTILWHVTKTKVIKYYYNYYNNYYYNHNYYYSNTLENESTQSSGSDVGELWDLNRPLAGYYYYYYYYY